MNKFLCGSMLALALCLSACATAPSSRHVSSFGKKKKDAEDFSCEGTRRKFEVKWDASKSCHLLTVSNMPGTWCLSGGDVGHLIFSASNDRNDDQNAKFVTLYVFGQNSYTSIADGSYYGASHEVDDAKCTLDLRSGAE